MNNTKKPIQKSSAEDIMTLEGLEAIRKLPGMYISEIGSAGVFRLYVEAVGNVLDLYNEGACKNVYISIDEKKEEITVADDAYGLPLEKIHDIMMKPHTSGKFENKGYSIGMHGVGNKCINALSSELIILVKRDGYKWTMSFSEGKIVKDLTRKEATTETGTTFKFKPDHKVLGDFEIDSMEYLNFVETLSYMCKGLEINFHAKTKEGKTINKRLKSENGLLDLMKKEEKNPLLKESIFIEDKQDNSQLKLAINYSTKRDEELILSHVNTMRTKAHGTHVQGLRMALTRVFKKYIDDNSLLSKKDAKLEITGEDVAEGISVMMELKWVNPMFEGQVKDKFTTKEAMGYVQKVVGDQLTTWLNSNKNDAKVICNKIILAAKGRAASKRAKLATKKKETGFASISSLSKYTKASSKNPEELELFIVEGLSAGASVSQGRDTETQAVYRLRGKPLNTHDATNAKVMSNKEFSDIVTILGCGIDKTFDISKLTHDKIIIMADADVDGSHIAALLITFFFIHMPEIISEGHLYIGSTPLYKVRENGKDFYLQDKEEYNKFIRNRIMNKYTLGNIIDGKVKPLTKKEYEVLLKNTSDYLVKVSNCASNLAATPELVETIALCKGLELKDIQKVIKKKYKELEVTMTKGGLFVDGLIGTDYQSLMINDNLYLDLKPVTDILETVNVTSLAMKEKSETKARKTSLINFLGESINNVTPTLSRFKGLGELNPDQLRETSMDPKNRNLTQVTVEDAENSAVILKNLMGNNAEPRKVFFEDFEIALEDLDG